MVATSINILLIPQALRLRVSRASRWLLLSTNPQAGKYYGGAVSAPVFGAIMGGVLRTMNIEPDALTTGDKNEFVINQGEGTGGRS